MISFLVMLKWELINIFDYILPCGKYPKIYMDGNKMKRLWERITGIGITSDTPESDIKHIRLFNILIILTAFMNSGFIPMLSTSLPDTKIILWHTIIINIIYLIALWFNHRMWHLFARLHFAVFGIINMVIMTLFFGANTNMHFIFPMAILLHFFLYPARQRYLMYAHAIILTLVYIFLEFYVTTHPPLITLPEEFIRATRQSFMISIPVYIAVPCFYIYNVFRHAEEALSNERAKSEALLLNILPKSIANRLKTTPGLIADGFAEATILFSDIVGFTKLSQKVEPDELVNLLNNIFSKFDELTEQFNLEKIKTIGDAYMVAAGLPEKREDHAEVMIDFALEMLEEIKAFNKEYNSTLSIRIGINSGSVVAGVIGKKKFIYDLWGDAVNTAARMESHGIPGEIQITEGTFNLVKGKYICEPRGQIEVKGKGIMTTYLVKGR